MQYGALQMGPKNWGSGLAQIGQALLARRAATKADKAEAAASEEKQRIQAALMKQMGYTPEQEALYQVGGLDAVNAQEQRDYNRGRDKIADQRWQQTQDYRASRDQVADQRYAETQSYQRGRDQVADQRYAEGLEYRDGRDAVEDSRYNAQIAAQAAPKYQFLNTDNGVMRGDPKTGEVVPMGGGFQPRQQAPQPFNYQSPFEKMQLQPISETGRDGPVIIPQAQRVGETVRLGGHPMAQSGGEVPAVNGHVRTGNQYNSNMDMRLPESQLGSRVGGRGASSPFDSTLDREAAKDANEWLDGGQAQAIAGLQQFRQLIDELENGDLKNKNLSGAAISWLPEGMSPNATDVEDRIGSVVQKSLRSILGAAYTQKEGEDVIKRAWNPSLPEKYNIPRLKRAYEQMLNDAMMKDRKAAYARQMGTMRGYAGHLPEFNEVTRGAPEPNAPGGPSIQMYNQAVQASGGAPVQIQSAEDYENLAPGTPFIAPDGKKGVKR